MKFHMKAKRNKIIFRKNVQYDILNENLLNKIKQYENIFLNDWTFEIQITNTHQWTLKIYTHSNNYLYYDFDDDLIYLEVNNIILINKNNCILFDTIKVNLNEIQIFRHKDSFHQNDSNIGNYLYEAIINQINFNIFDIGVFIGGEMVLFGLLLLENYLNGYFYSDFESIVNDAKVNCFNNVELIDYDSCNINISQKYKTSFCICNTGKSGLGKNLSNNILKLKFDTIFIVSCNEKSFTRDFEILKNNYVINKKTIITTNYSICLYELIII